MMLQRLERLGRMSVEEITYRGRQEASKWHDRSRRRRRAPWEDAGRVLAREAPGVGDPDRLRGRLAGRLFAAGEAGAIARLYRTAWPAEAAALATRAGRLRAGRFDLLGYRDLAFGDPIDWQLDPVSGRRAPDVHWSALDPLDTATVGDSKVVWELSRHQWLVTLALAARVTGDGAAAGVALTQLDDWLRANPYARGMNWASSLEAGLRLIAWCWTLALLRDAPELTPARLERVVVAIRTHAVHVERYLSRYFSPNTHLTGEALALFYAGTLLPELRDAGRWQRLGRDVLVDELRRQVDAEGVHMERASCYQRYTLEIYLHFAILAARHRVALPADVASRLLAMARMLAALCDARGRMPAIGDADGGWLLPFTARDPDDCRGVLAVAAVHLGRNELAASAGGAVPEVAWLLGTAAVDRLECQRVGARPDRRSRLFAAGGLAIQRDERPGTGHTLMLDVGPLGCAVSGGHGHADLLALQCWAFGEPYVVDPGTGCYTADRRWRDHFRSTAAHATITVDGAGQAEPAGPFAWRGTRPAARLRAWETTATEDFVDASHDAYARLADPVVHRRRVLFVRPLFWLVIDDLTGAARHDVALRFPFASRPLRAGADGWVVMAGARGGGLWLRCHAPVPLETRIAVGDERRPEGWVSPAYGCRLPAPVLVRHGVVQLPLRIVTAIVPVATVGDPPAFAATTGADGAIDTVRVGRTVGAVHIDDRRLVIDGRSYGA